MIHHRNELALVEIGGTKCLVVQHYTGDPAYEPTTIALVHPPHHPEARTVATLRSLHTDQPGLQLADDAPSDLRDLLEDDTNQNHLIAEGTRIWRQWHHPNQYRDDLPEPQWWLQALNTSTERAERQRILEDLITLRVPTSDSIPSARYRKFWGVGRPLTVLRHSHVAHVLDLYHSGDMAWPRVTAWAETVLYHLGAPGRRAYLAVEPGARAALVTALTSMTCDEPRNILEYRAIRALVRDDTEPWHDRAWAPAVAVLLTAGVGTWTYPWDLASELESMLPASLHLPAALAVAVPAAACVLAWASAGLKAATRQLEFWSVLFGVACIVVTVFDFGLLT